MGYWPEFQKAPQPTRVSKHPGLPRILPVLALKVPCPRKLLSPRSTEAVGHLAAPGSIVLVDECHSVELRVASESLSDARGRQPGLLHELVMSSGSGASVLSPYSGHISAVPLRARLSAHKQAE